MPKRNILKSTAILNFCGSVLIQYKEYAAAMTAARRADACYRRPLLRLHPGALLVRAGGLDQLSLSKMAKIRKASMTKRKALLIPCVTPIKALLRISYHMREDPVNVFTAAVTASVQRYFNSAIVCSTLIYMDVYAAAVTESAAATPVSELRLPFALLQVTEISFFAFISVPQKDQASTNKRQSSPRPHLVECLCGSGD